MFSIESMSNKHFVLVVFVLETCLVDSLRMSSSPFQDENLRRIDPVFGPSFKINTKRFTTARLETRTKESYNNASICLFKRRMRSESKTALEHERGLFFLGRRIHSKHYCRDPKDGELCLNNLKSGESLMEECKRF